MSHVDGELEGQIVTVINDENVNHADFTFDIPADYTLKNANDGKLSLMNVEGDTVATVDAPWAVDATGQHLPTYYELIPASSTIRQHVDTKGATYPIAVDPSWWWWTATAATCVVEVGPLFLSFGAGIAAKVAKVVSRINKMKSDKKIAQAIKRAGGAVKLAVLKAKEAYNKLYDSVKNSRAKKYLKKKFDFSPAEKKTLSLAWAFGVSQVTDLLGIGSCVSLVRGK